MFPNREDRLRDYGNPGPQVPTANTRRLGFSSAGVTGVGTVVSVYGRYHTALPESRTADPGLQHTPRNSDLFVCVRWRPEGRDSRASVRGLPDMTTISLIAVTHKKIAIPQRVLGLGGRGRGWTVNPYEIFLIWKEPSRDLSHPPSARARVRIRVKP